MPATIEIRSRLWNSTLAEDYNGFDKSSAFYFGLGSNSGDDLHVDFVEIFSKAAVIVDSDISQDPTDDYASVRTVAYPDSRKRLGEAFPEWWIVAASVAVGLLLLVIICLILRKLGFFKRKLVPNSSALDDEDDADFMLSANFEKVKLNAPS